MNYEQIITDFIESLRDAGKSDLTIKIFELRIRRILDKLDIEITDSRLDAALYCVTKERELSFPAWQTYYYVLKQFKKWYFKTDNMYLKNGSVIKPIKADTDIIRGRRAKKFDLLQPDFYVDTAIINKVLEPFVNKDRKENKADIDMDIYLSSTNHLLHEINFYKECDKCIDDYCEHPHCQYSVCRISDTMRFLCGREK